MTKEAKNTKELIMEKASELFAMTGFQGTSIREIAQVCDVNVASINYYFGSKQGLYVEISNRSYDWLENGLREIGEKTDKLDEFVVKSFEFIISKPEVICTSVRLILTDGLDDPENSHCQYKGYNGPPGSEFFYKMIQKEFDEKLPEKATDFLVKNLFSQVLHYAMIYSSPRFDEIKKKVSGLNKETICENLKHHTRAVTAYVNSNKEMKL
jgi:AcrR family transcriptional regulator